MPLVSKAQTRLMYARANSPPAKERRYGKGPSKAVAQEFVNASHGQDLSKLPERVKKK
jgi:hypothetical protein